MAKLKFGSLVLATYAYCFNACIYAQALVLALAPPLIIPAFVNHASYEEAIWYV